MDLIKLNRKDKVVCEAEFKLLDETYIDEILELQNEVYNNLENKELYVASSKEEFMEYILQNKGYLLGCITASDNKLIAMGVYRKLGYNSENYGYDLDIKGEELLKVGQLELTVVKDEFRGNKLQKIICEKLEELGKKDGVTLMTVTASPYNQYSLNTLESLGYTVRKDKLKYGGLRRYVLAKEIIL